MALPKSVIEAGERADQLQKGTQPQGTPENQAPEQSVNPAQQVMNESQQTAPQQPAEDSWEHRFKVLQGKYSAEVPRLHNEMKDLKAQLQTAIEKMGEMQAYKPQATPDLSMLTEEEREQYGDEFVNFVAKVAKANSSQQADPNVANRLKHIESAVAETREEKFFAGLTTKAANWESLNTDTSFLAWLAEADPLSGRARQSLFDEAYQSLNIDRVANFFNGYSGANQSSVSRDMSRPTLDSQVVPAQARSAPAPLQSKPYWFAKDISNFYNDVRRGVYRDKAADIARIEQDIFAAQREGRVR